MINHCHLVEGGVQRVSSVLSDEEYLTQIDDKLHNMPLFPVLKACQQRLLQDSPTSTVLR